ncbi:MAG: hypothetical protein QW743_03520 [Candidatus Methanomethylicia archaeon]
MKRIHKGIILDSEIGSFDSGGATFATVFHDINEVPNEYFMFYTGSHDPGWSKAYIGLAISRDGINFYKLKKPVLNPEEFNYREAVTPVVFRVKNTVYMIFAGSPYGKGRRICIAYSDDLKGPFHFLRVLIEPKELWEGMSIDLGPNIVKLNEDQFILYYSNVSNKPWERILRPKYLFTPTFWLRRIGILKLKIKSPKNIEVYRLGSLQHLNGPKGSWNESLFCPGYFSLGNRHYLLPAASTYSVGFPYKQYIGLAIDSSPLFRNPKSFTILIDGPKEKKQIIPGIRSEIALDTPCPIIIGDKLYLYYAVMDRSDNIWKMALTIFPLNEFL